MLEAQRQFYFNTLLYITLDVNCIFVGLVDFKKVLLVNEVISICYIPKSQGYFCNSITELS